MYIRTLRISSVFEPVLKIFKISSISSLDPSVLVEKIPFLIQNFRKVSLLFTMQNDRSS